MRIAEIFSPSEPYRAPHHGRELELMLAGTKPAALIDASPGFKEKADKLIQQGRIKLIAKDQEGDYVVTLPGEEWRGEEILKLISSSDRGREYDIKLGKLLGYSGEAIQWWIDQTD